MELGKYALYSHTHTNIQIIIDNISKDILIRSPNAYAWTFCTRIQHKTHLKTENEWTHGSLIIVGWKGIRNFVRFNPANILILNS